MAGQVEVSLFGPGYGECVVVGTDGMWIIVDSCVDERGDSPALSYLRSIGVDPATAVRFVIATHWHDDHVRGLAAVVDQCKSAQFIMSAALNHDEFMQLTEVKNTSATSGPTTKLSAGVEEFADVLHIMETRTNLSGERAHASLAVPDKRIWQRAATSTAPACEIWSLSPSDQSILKAQQDMAQLLKEARENSASSQVRAMGPNHTAVVLWVKVGADTILLGSDLEENRSVGGWTAIIASAGRPTEQAGVFKIAHHGSANAHHPGLWSGMLTADPVAILTRFQRGSVSLPKGSDIARIKGLTSRAYVTSAGSVPKKKRSTTVEKTIKGAVKNIRSARPPMGHIRLRSSGAGWDVELFGAAAPL